MVSFKQTSINKAFLLAAISISSLGAGYFTIKKLRQLAIIGKIIRKAKSYIGEREIEPNQGFVSGAFQKIMYDLGQWRPGSEWCASFTRLIWLLSLSGKKKEIAARLLSPSSQLTFANFAVDKSGLFEVSNKPRPGAIIIWQSLTSPAKGHAGIFISMLGANYLTIEGNQKQKVTICSYTPAKMLNPSNAMKLRGFINIK
jgi:hypothetical protein